MSIQWEGVAGGRETQGIPVEVRTEMAHRAAAEVSATRLYYEIWTGDALVLAMYDQETGGVEVFDCTVRRIGTVVP